MKINKKTKLFLAFLGFALLSITSVDIPTLELDYSKVLFDKNGNLLAAKISKDQQWRFPIEDPIPNELSSAIILFEDEYFHYHPGINPVSIIKAFYTNWKAKKILRGGSTITMQLMRMYRGNQSRNYYQKLIEILGAIKIEILNDKDEILKMWASIAPFGGNTVGASTASWRYYGRNLNELSWAEYVTLAVLPNSPSKIHMEKNVIALKAKRDTLLSKLFDHQIIDSLNYQLATDENIIFNQKPIPSNSIHLLEFLISKYPKQHIFNSTIDQFQQTNLTKSIQSQLDIYQLDGINNCAAMIIDYKNNELVAYLGNVNSNKNELRFVDCVQSPRSYGSLLKPFLYSYAIDNGYFLPNELIKDVPTYLDGFSPRNFDRKFRGLVPLDQIISHSLNVPAVRVLNYVGLESFHDFIINDLQFQHINKNPHYHGLSLILGGAESTLWELANAYKGLLRNYYQINSPFGELVCLKNKTVDPNGFMFSPITLKHTINAMSSVNRPKEEQHFAKMGGPRIAWKTGTSYGHKDAWAVGANGQYIVAAWLGNETGEGIYNLTGSTKAAPILFNVFRNLSDGGSVEDRIISSQKAPVCNDTGRLKGRYCNHSSLIDVNKISHQLRNCDAHSIEGSVNRTDTLYAMNATEEYYYSKFYNNKTESLSRTTNSNKLSVVYPQNNTVIFVPKKLDENYSMVEFKANSTYESEELFWFLNNEFLSSTTSDHQLSSPLAEGDYSLLVNDSKGNSITTKFSVSKR